MFAGLCMTRGITMRHVRPMFCCPLFRVVDFDTVAAFVDRLCLVVGVSSEAAHFALIGTRSVSEGQLALVHQLPLAYAFGLRKRGEIRHSALVRQRKAQLPL